MRSITAPRPHALERLRLIEERGAQALVRIEKKLIDFPFSRYFVGHQKPTNAEHKPDWRSWKNDRLTLAWLGHSTVLINFYGTWILTDPVFSDRVGIRVGPATVGPRRLVHPPLTPQELPPIDVVLVSHAHMDHTDMPSLKAVLRAGSGSRVPGSVPTLIIAANTKDIYTPLESRRLHELDWGEEIFVAPAADTRVRLPDSSVRIEALQTRHAGWRMPWDSCRSRNEKNGRSFNAYLVETRDEHGELHAFVFGGDTGYITTFRALGDRMRAEGREIECAIMPIGTYNPWIDTHCNPEQAWRMTLEMNAHTIVPVHWNTYTQSSEPRYEPIEWLRALIDVPSDIALSEHGETWSNS